MMDGFSISSVSIFVCSVSILNRFWVCSGSVLEMASESVLDRLHRFCIASATVMSLFWIGSKMMDRFCISSVSVLNRFKDDGSVVYRFWMGSESVLKRFCLCSGSVQG